MKMVIICPKAVMESWRRVIVNHFKMGDNLVDIINYEQLRIGKRESKVASFILNKKTHREKFTWKISKDTLIIWDESQKLKNWKTKNSKTCVEAFKQGYKMLFCSATMAVNPMDLRTVGTCMKMFKGAKDYYEWLYDQLLKYRNDSGDSYKKMSGSIYLKITNKTKFQETIKNACLKIKEKLNVKDWEHATQDQLIMRDKIHDRISLLCDVIPIEDAIRIGIEKP
jgi:hypothetical protein